MKKAEIKELGENLFEIILPTWCMRSKPHLIAGILKIQEKYNKTITTIRLINGFKHDSYLIITASRESIKRG